MKIEIMDGAHSPVIWIIMKETSNKMLPFELFVLLFKLPSLQSISNPSDVWFINVQLFGEFGLPAAMIWNTHGSFCCPTALSAQHINVP